MSAMTMTTVSTTNGYDKSFPPMDVSSKKKNGMTCIKTAINGSISFPEANCRGGAVSSTEMQSVPAVDEGSDCLGYQRRLQLVNNDMGFLDLSPFTIRNFVSTVRSKEFSKCWPFRLGILERCLSNGMKPQLPPFDLPSKGQGQVCLEKQPAIADVMCIQVVSKPTESITHSLSEESGKQKLAGNETFMVTNALADAPGNCVAVNPEVGHAVEVQLEGKKSEEERSEAINNIDQSGTMAIEGAVSERPHGGKEAKADKVVEAGTETSPGVPHTNEVDVMKEQDKHGGSGAYVSGDLKTLCSESEGMTSVLKYLGPNRQTLNPLNPEFDTIPVVRGDPNFHSDAKRKIGGQEHTADGRLFFEKFSTQAQCQKLADTQCLEPLHVSTCMKTCRTAESYTKQETSGIATTLPTEGDVMGHQNRIETVKNSEDFGVTGINLDLLTSQVCPVCLNFTSTSNTALNAHIDHCLAAALPGEKAKVGLQKNRIKTRKKRSMVDICAVAPPRTLEDLEMSSQLWALIDETPTENAACSLGWKDGTVRRQPRTRLHRGPAGAWNWKGENEPRQTLPSTAQNCHHLENARKKYPVPKTAPRTAKLGISSSSSTNTSRNDGFELQESHRNQQSHGEGLFLSRLSRPACVPSSVHTGKSGLARHKNLMQNLRRWKVGQGSSCVQNALESSSMHKSMEKRQLSKTVNPFLCSKPIERLCEKCEKHESGIGSSPLHSSSERVIQHCYHCTEQLIDKVSNDPGTSAPQQLVSAATKDKTSLDSALIQTNESLKCFHQDKGFIGTMKRKEKKNGVLNQISAQCITKKPRFISRLDQKPADHIWSDTFDCHDIIPVDTSAEEANLLLKEHGCFTHFPHGRQLEAEIAEQQGLAGGFTLESGNTNENHSKITDFSKLVVAAELHIETSSLENKGVFNSSQLEQEGNSERIAINLADKQGAIENWSELSIKNKKVALKTKSIVNITTVPKDKDNGACGMLGVEKEACVDEWPTVNSNGETCLKTTPIDALRNNQIKILKRKHIGSTKGDTLREACNKNKHARLDIAKRKPLSCNVGLCHATQQSKSPEGSSVVSSRALTEHRPQGGVESDSNDAASLALENPQKETECENMNKEFRSQKTSRAISSHTCSEDLNEDENLTFLVKQMKKLAGNTNELDKQGSACQSDANQVNLFQNGAANCTNNCESSKKAMPMVDLGETHSTSMAKLSKKRVNSISLLEKTERFRLAPSVTSLSDAALHKFSSRTSSRCNPTTCSSLGFVIDTCCRPADGCYKVHPPLTTWEAGVSNKLPFFQPVDSIRTSHASHSYTAGIEVPICAAPAVGLENCISSANFPSAWVDNAGLSATAPSVGMMNHDLHSISSLRRVNNPDGLKCELPVLQLTPQVSFSTTDFCDNSVVMANQHLQNTQAAVSTADRSDLFVSNSIAQNSREAHLKEGVQKIISVGHGNVDASDGTVMVQNIQEILGPKRSASCMRSMVLNPVSSGVSVQDNCKLVHEAATLGDAQRHTMSDQKMSFTSDLLVDLARTIADDSTDSRGARDTLPNMLNVKTPVNVNIQRSTSNMSLKCTPNELHNVHEQMNLMPLQNTCCYNMEMSGGAIEPQLLQSAMQLLNGNACTNTADHIDLMPESVNGTSQLLTLPSNQPICGQFSSAGMNGRRQENLSGAELTSSLNGYGSVDYPGDQGVVHIFGNPVFKLMGKNVMVSNKDAKPLGMDSTVMENGRQGLHEASSVQRMECRGTAQDLGLFQDTRNQFSQPFLEAQFCSNPNSSSCWRGDSHKPRNHSVTTDNLVIHSHATQNLSLPACGSMGYSGYRDPSISKPSIPLVVSGERLRTCGSAAGVHQTRQAVVNSVNQTHAEVIAPNNSLQSSGNFMPTILCKGGCALTQQNGRPWFEYPFSLSMDEPQLHCQGQTLPFRQSSNSSTDFLVDLLGLSASNNFHCSNQRSGTLSDIFQSLHRGKDRLWSTQPGPMHQTQLSHT